MLWVGDRTRQLDHAHIEYLRGIKNPIGLKCGPSLTPDDLLRLIDMLNPANEPGRLTLICRFGADKVGDHLPALIRAVQREGRTSLWSCDPMHGNTIKRRRGYKTRPVRRIMQEIRSFFAVHQRRRHLCRRHASRNDRQERHRMHRRRPRHFGSRSADRYHTYCDPRLNAEQAIEVAFLVADLLKGQRLAQPERPMQAAE